MFRSCHPKRSESLAEYYYRINRHLLGRVKLAEFNPASKELYILDGTKSTASTEKE